MGVLESPLPTDYTDESQTDQGVHADAHNAANDALNKIDPILEEVQILMWMEP